MFRVTTIREHATRAGRVFTATGRTVPGPLGLLVQGIVLLLLVGLVLVITLPVLIVGGLIVIGGLLYAAVRRTLSAGRDRFRDDGRRNVRVIEPSGSSET